MTLATEANAQTVSRVCRGPDRTTVELANGEALDLPPFRYVSPGDRLRRRRLMGLDLILKQARSAHGRPGWVILSPAYRHVVPVPISPFEEKVIIRERLSESDWRKAKPLEQFHYRGKGLDRMVGRRSVLLAEIEGLGIVGYGVVSSTLPAVAPRMEFFQTTFKEQYSTGLINRLARIPRVVVHPEFRNIGLGRLLSEHLVRYARHWWDIRGSKPLAVEVVAAMTEYHPFFERAGFAVLGMTRASGVVMPRYGTGGWAPRPNASKYDFETPRTPKPYLMRGLTLQIAKRIAAAFPSRHSSPDGPQRGKDAGLVASAKNTALRYQIGVQGSRRVQIVRDAFGIDSGQLEFPVIRGLTCTIRPGDVVLISGASGSGKSTLLRALGGVLGTNGTVETSAGALIPASPEDAAWLNLSFPSGRAVVDQFSCELDDAIAALNATGLGEAHLYLKPPAYLSDGQRLRLGLAVLATSRKSVWLADDFLVNLDRRTASIVAWGLSRLARRTGRTVMTASPDPSPFLQSFLPNVMVDLKWAAKPQVSRLNARRSGTRRRPTVALRVTARTSECEVWEAGHKVRRIATFALEPGRSFEVPVSCSEWAVVRTSRGLGCLLPPVRRSEQLRLCDMSAVEQ
jgi:ABC-type lipoprotein export system ATPase subunit/GNAT superfamily N-acetyltransferase